MKIILLGAPGSGKGTLAKQISSDFNIPQISTGDLFRAIVKDNSTLGKKVKELINGGSLVPDDITIKILKQRIAKEDCQNGYILDGFPRTINQAVELEKITNIDAIILLDIPFETIVQRLSSRRTCAQCGEIYNTSSYNLPICAKCGGGLIVRDDDKPQSIKHRLEVYETTTSPLIDFYSDRLFKVSSAKSPEETYRSVKAYLDRLEGKSE